MRKIPISIHTIPCEVVRTFTVIERVAISYKTTICYPSFELTKLRMLGKYKYIINIHISYINTFDLVLAIGCTARVSQPVSHR